MHVAYKPTMTSVTLPSNSGPMHGGFSTVAEETNTSEHDFETSRPAKRCLAAPTNDSCKKRRKQSTPIRISAADSETAPSEGKPVLSPEPELRCPVCQYVFSSQENLENHVTAEHANIECKKEPEELVPQSADYDETPTELTAPKSEVPWMGDLQNKEWMNPSLLPFNPAANPMFMPLPMPSRQPIRIFNPDAYCELCNKEFCNKYFLKTHKANKHGIYSDPISSEPSEPSGSIPSYTNIKLSTSVPSLEVSMENKSVVNPFTDIFPNQFFNKIFPKISKPSILGMYQPENGESVKTLVPNGLLSSEGERTLPEDPGEESPSPPVVQFESTSFKDSKIEQETMYTPPSKMSPGQQRELDLSNRLRKIGVMNPKAFCEICCKEYCNKYFLRTHKMKRHGIYIPDENKDKDMKMDMWPQNMQTSPLNLIMSEQNISSSSFGDRKTSSPPEISCEQCGIKFQNASLAQLHHVTVHGKTPCSQEIPDNSQDSRKVGDAEKLANNSDSISEDLQKLQTMILQLNDLDVNKMSTSCSTCNKEFENRYYLHLHMATEHGLLLNELPDVEKVAETENSSNNNTMCELCGKDLPNVDEMKKHLTEFHSQVIHSEVKDEFPTPEKTVNKIPVSSGQLSERRSSMSLTPTSSYCEICNKELCNKYFMKTHMQRMHGIEIENGAQIGGVVCDICNKELCSKYFLRVHKHNTHGIVEYGTSLLQPRKEESPHVTEPDSALKPADLADLSHRYFAHFTEVCSICSRRFRSTKWLKAHLLSDHGQIGAEKWAELEQQLQQTMGQSSKSSSSKTPQSESVSPTLKIPNGGQDFQKTGIQNVLSSLLGADETNVKSYNCSLCPFSTPVLPFLFVHERSHSIQATEGTAQFKCPVCSQIFPQAELFQHHVFTQHPLLPPPPFFNGNNEIQSEIPKEPSEAAEDLEDSGSSSDTSKKPPSKVKKGSRSTRFGKVEVSPDLGQTLKDVAKKCQLTATYALPQTGEEAPSPASGYVMQAFLLDEAASERRFVPSVVFLPVLQKQSGPVNVTFTLTPA